MRKLLSHLKQEILKDVEIAIKTSIDNNKKNDIVSCLQSHIDTLLSEIYFLREEIRQKNQLIKAAFRSEDIIPRVAQNNRKNDRNTTNDKTTDVTVLNNKEKTKKLDSNTRSNTASINTVISETSDRKSNPENIETKSSLENTENRNPSNDCEINEQTNCLTIIDKKSSIQENKRTKDVKKKKQKQANDNAYINNGNKIKITVYILGDSMVKKTLQLSFDKKN